MPFAFNLWDQVCQDAKRNNRKNVTPPTVPVVRPIGEIIKQKEWSGIPHIRFCVRQWSMKCNYHIIDAFTNSILFGIFGDKGYLSFQLSNVHTKLPSED